MPGVGVGASPFGEVGHPLCLCCSSSSQLFLALLGAKLPSTPRFIRVYFSEVLFLRVLRTTIHELRWTELMPGVGVGASPFGEVGHPLC
ncbi:MAG: hypothetical protein PHE61_03355 [Candidatus Omnitrophica bacterium]|nr:hypothetical protein [Candidatus Omnitrophota bacterium]